MTITQFLLTYWREIVSTIAVIASIIIMAIKKRPVINEMDNIILKVLEKLPEWINSAESFKGADVKKALVLESVKKYVKDQFSVNLPDTYLESISQMIEVILSTPQKKG